MTLTTKKAQQLAKTLRNLAAVISPPTVRLQPSPVQPQLSKISAKTWQDLSIAG